MIMMCKHCSLKCIVTGCECKCHGKEESFEEQEAKITEKFDNACNLNFPLKGEE